MTMSRKKSLYRQDFLPNAAEIGERHKQIREEKGLSQDKLAKKFKIGRSTISECEAGNQEFPLSYIVSFCKEYAVNLVWLIEGDNWPKYINDVITSTVSKLSDNMSSPYYKKGPGILDEVIDYMKKHPDFLKMVWHKIQAKTLEERWQKGDSPL